MEREEIIEELEQLKGWHDREMAHVEADQLLCKLLIELGYKDVVDAWENIDKWYA
jgi:hypothetical protein